MGKKYYLHDYSLSPLSREDEKETIRKFKLHNDKKAFDLLFLSNMRLVIKCVNDFLKNKTHLIQYRDDFIQEGFVALIEAINDYKLDFIDVMKFSSYYSIHFLKCSANRFPYLVFDIGYPMNIMGKIFKYVKYREKFFDDNSRYPTKEEIIQHFNMPAKLVNNILLLLSSSDDDECIINAHDDINPIDTLFHKSLIEQSLNCLNTKEKFSVIHYYGIFDNDKLNLREIGEKLSVTKERARQLIFNSQEKMKLYMKRNMDYEGFDEENCG